MKSNKLPEIGAIYSHKKYLGQECLIINITDERIVYEVVKSSGKTKGNVGSYNKSVVWDFLKPLPKEQDHNEDKLEKVKEAKEELKKQILENEEVGKDYGLQSCVNNLLKAAQNLINALDPIKEDKYVTATEIENRKNNHDLDEPIVKVFDKFRDPYKKVLERVFKEDKTEESLPKSIWKDVSELPDNQMVIMENRSHYFRIGELYEDKFYFMEADSGEVISHEIHKGNLEEFCTLTDFVNQQKQNTKDIAELKQLIKGKHE